MFEFPMVEVCRIIGRGIADMVAGADAGLWGYRNGEGIRSAAAAMGDSRGALHHVGGLQDLLRQPLRV
ncbi:MAG: hypothetical protein JSW21_11970, partial [Gammaproteobacteria bacterium]